MVVYHYLLKPKCNCCNVYVHVLCMKLKFLYKINFIESCLPSFYCVGFLKQVLISHWNMHYLSWLDKYHLPCPVLFHISLVFVFLNFDMHKISKTVCVCVCLSEIQMHDNLLKIQLIYAYLILIEILIC